MKSWTNDDVALIYQRLSELKKTCQTIGHKQTEKKYVDMADWLNGHIENYLSTFGDEEARSSKYVRIANSRRHEEEYNIAQEINTIDATIDKEMLSVLVNDERTQMHEAVYHLATALTNIGIVLGQGKKMANPGTLPKTVAEDTNWTPGKRKAAKITQEVAMNTPSRPKPKGFFTTTGMRKVRERIEEEREQNEENTKGTAR